MNIRFCLLFFPMVLLSNPLELVITPDHHQAMPLKIIVSHPFDENLVVDDLASLLGATKQFSLISTLSQVEPKTKQAMMKIFQDGFPLALFLSGDDEQCSWRLYDAMSASLIKGKKCFKKNLSTPEWAIVIADEIWPELTGQVGSFASLIAVCKRRGKGIGRGHRDLYLIHPFYTTAQFEPIKLVGRGNNFAPRWHKRRSVIFYSQHTQSNVRLMSVDAHHEKRIITSFEGQNMTPAISADGKVVLALSSNDFTQLYEYLFDVNKKKSSFVRLTNKSGDFISPSFLHEDKVVFCCVNHAHVPQLGIMDLKKKRIEWLKVGRALCPAVSPSGKDLAYCKKVEGTYQLFKYDLESREEQQLTRGLGHKDECSWSPCGNYITSSIESGELSRICLVDVNTQALRYLTALDEYWSYPNWSPMLALPFAYQKNG